MEIKGKNSSVRRKLLKAVVYAPPVILGSLIATPRSVMGVTIGQTKTCNLTGGGSVMIVISSGTNACCPCIPGSTVYNINKCNRLRCLLSCGTNCAPGVLATVRCKRFCKKCGFTPVGCKIACTCSPHPTKPGKFKCV